MKKCSKEIRRNTSPGAWYATGCGTVPDAFPVCAPVRNPFSIRSVACLDTPVMYVRGVGPRVAEMLAPKGIETAEDLLYHLPFRY